MVGQPESRLFVEGGGDDNAALKTRCRRAFSTLLEAAGLKGRMPRIVACGGRRQAYEAFCTALSDPGCADKAVLLVDAEAPVDARTPWEHVRTRPGDGWERPVGATDDQLHFMVQCMESWFVADRQTMVAFFGQGFQESALPAATAAIERVSKEDILRRIEQATRGARKKGAYDKGAHSFQILARLDPAAIRRASQWADRFFRVMARNS